MKIVREKTPLVHHITNYVTVNDCANVTICAGGSPVMSDEAKDIVDISRISSAVVLNMGTLNERTVESIIISGKVANEHGIPVVWEKGQSPLKALRLIPVAGKVFGGMYDVR